MRRSQLGAEVGAVGVVAHRADQPAGGADRGHVGGDVRRAAQGAARLADGHHGDRRLGREPVGVAHEISVEHHVTHDHDLPALHPVQQLDHPLAADRRA
jgi:hypothetical protein